MTRWETLLSGGALEDLSLFVLSFLDFISAYVLGSTILFREDTLTCYMGALRINACFQIMLDCNENHSKLSSKQPFFSVKVLS